VYALQVAPEGLVCYDNSFVLASEPMCSANSSLQQQFPISINYNNGSVAWSVLSQYAIASAMANALQNAGSNVAPADIYFHQESNTLRRLTARVDTYMTVQSSDKNLENLLDVAVRQYLEQELVKRNLDMVVELYSTLSSLNSPTPSSSLSSQPYTQSRTPSSAPLPYMVSSADSATTLIGIIVTITASVIII